MKNENLTSITEDKLEELSFPQERLQKIDRLVGKWLKQDKKDGFHLPLRHAWNSGNAFLDIGSKEELRTFEARLIKDYCALINKVIHNDSASTRHDLQKFYYNISAF